jgi:hypothetical protein
MKNIKESLSQVISQATQSSVSKTSETENGLNLQSKAPLTISTVLELLKTVDDISKPISPQRAGALAVELISLGFTHDEIVEGCKRYAASVASQFREIQLSDFTNPTITSERELREAVKALEEREKAFEARVQAFEREVERVVEKRLEEITIELRAISEHYPSRTVIAARALYDAKVELEAKKRREIEALIPKMMEKLNRAYQMVNDSVSDRTEL